MVATAVTVQPGFGGCFGPRATESWFSSDSSIPRASRRTIDGLANVKYNEESLSAASADFQARLGPEIPRTGWEEGEVAKLVPNGSAFKEMLFRNHEKVLDTRCTYGCTYRGEHP